AKMDQVVPAAWGVFGATGAIDAAPFAAPIDDYYMTDAVCRASPTMAECSALAHRNRQKATGTHG
ncbi:MAG TPA: hypothetical protein VEU47_16785, partial [Candidatus Cybelea sp.]|nr:hypothetical protein [Candidatus Cybelea sp.]